MKSYTLRPDTVTHTGLQFDTFRYAGLGYAGSEGEGHRQVVLRDVIDKARPYFDKANQGGDDGGDSHDVDRGCVGHCGLSGESGGKYVLHGPDDGAGGGTGRETVEEEDGVAASDSGRPLEPITFFMPGGNQHVQYDLSPHAITETCRRMTLDDEDCGRFHKAARERQRLGGVARPLAGGEVQW